MQTLIINPLNELALSIARAFVIFNKRMRGKNKKAAVMRGNGPAALRLPGLI
jgi:hypothetical protein